MLMGSIIMYAQVRYLAETLRRSLFVVYFYFVFMQLYRLYSTYVPSPPKNSPKDY